MHGPGLAPESFDAVTFDCYGTLIDWERGILGALPEALRGRSPGGDEALLELFAATESEVQRGPFRPYREVLTEVLRAMAATLGVGLSPDAPDRFAASVATWPPFADAPSALRVLSSHFRLAVVSNVDDDLFGGSRAQLGVDFDEVVTAQQVRSYKPSPRHFEEAIRRLSLPRERILHVAQSLFHDIEPARGLGFTTVWVNRRAGREGGGATPPCKASPDFEVPGLHALVGLLGLSLR